MDGLLSLLFFAGAFYLMMRFGCGAHMVHGHGHNHGENKNCKHVDPVCSKEVDVNEGYGKMHLGKLYRFCSRQCLDKFEVEPGRYVKSEGEES